MECAHQYIPVVIHYSYPYGSDNLSAALRDKASVIGPHPEVLNIHLQLGTEDNGAIRSSDVLRNKDGLIQEVFQQGDFRLADWADNAAGTVHQYSFTKDLLRVPDCVSYHNTSQSGIGRSVRES